MAASNWSGNHTYRAADLRSPASSAEVQEIVRTYPRVHAVGTRHSFNHVADAEGGVLISLDRLDRVLRVERAGDRATVTVEAGITYAQLCAYLAPLGLALPNLASLPHISVAGACATGTHGSGDALRSLADAVSGVKLIDPAGEVREFGRARSDVPLEAVVVSLGGLGVVTELTLDLVQAFDLEQRVYERLTLDAVQELGFDTLTGSAYSVSLFTDWQDRTFNQVWLKSRAGEAHLDLTRAGAVAATAQRHPAQGTVGEASLRAFIYPEKCTQQLGVPGPWHARMPHFRAEDQPSSSGEELQTEYVIHRRDALPAMEALFALAPQVAPLIQISEIRTVAASDLWLSPFYGRPSACIHFTWRKDLAGVAALLPLIEDALKPFAPRPHWGKLFAMGRARLEASYAGGRLDEFRGLLRSLDPAGKFRNGFITEHLL